MHEELVSHGNPEHSGECIGITASYDAGWQCRGSSRSYNSKSGHGALIGENTGKVLNFTTRICNCKKCEVSGPSSEHDCRRNWDGSAKAMEADMAVEMLNQTKGDTYQVTKLVGDEDACTMAKVRELVSHPVDKVSDMNHSQKTVTTCFR